MTKLIHIPIGVVRLLIIILGSALVLLNKADDKLMAYKNELENRHNLT